MPPRPAWRLSLHLCPTDPDRDDDVEATLSALLALFPEPVRGGAAVRRALRAERPLFVSCGQGGFRAFCPDSGAILSNFGPALSRYRAGGPRRLECPCGQKHDLAALRFVPEAGFGRSWILFEDVGSDVLEEGVEAWLTTRWGGVKVVASRG